MPVDTTPLPRLPPLDTTGEIPRRSLPENGPHLRYEDRVQYWGPAKTAPSVPGVSVTPSSGIASLWLATSESPTPPPSLATRARHPDPLRTLRLHRFVYRSRTTAGSTSASAPQTWRIAVHASGEGGYAPYWDDETLIAHDFGAYVPNTWGKDRGSALAQNAVIRPPMPSTSTGKSGGRNGKGTGGATQQWGSIEWARSELAELAKMNHMSQSTLLSTVARHEQVLSMNWKGPKPNIHVNKEYHGGWRDVSNGSKLYKVTPVPKRPVQGAGDRGQTANTRTGRSGQNGGKLNPSALCFGKLKTKP